MLTGRLPQLTIISSLGATKMYNFLNERSGASEAPRAWMNFMSSVALIQLRPPRF